MKGRCHLPCQRTWTVNQRISKASVRAKEQLQPRQHFGIVAGNEPGIDADRSTPG